MFGTVHMYPKARQTTCTHLVAEAQFAVVSESEHSDGREQLGQSEHGHEGASLGVVSPHEAASVGVDESVLVHDAEHRARQLLVEYVLREGRVNLRDVVDGAGRRHGVVDVATTAAVSRCKHTSRDVIVVTPNWYPKFNYNEKGSFDNLKLVTMNTILLI